MHRGVPVRRVVIVVVIWALPLLVAPPLFSRDVYSYAGQGEMVSHHIDPYVYGTGVLGSTPFSTMPDSVWTNTPSPYGPTFLSIDGLLDKASGHEILPDVVLLRLLEVAGLALVVAATSSLARRMGRDPAGAVLLGAGCPLVLATLIGGAHNEGTHARPPPGGSRGGPAMGHGSRRHALRGRGRGEVAGRAGCPVLGVGLGRFWRVLRAAGGPYPRGRGGRPGHLGVISAVSGTGWGWLRTTTAADKSFTGVTPVNAVAKVLSGAARLVEITIPVLGARTVISIIGLACAAAIGAWLLLRSSGSTMQRNLGLTLLAVALLGPILWNWYVTWGVIVLAPVVTGTLRRVIIIISTFEILVGLSSVKNLGTTLVHAGHPA